MTMQKLETEGIERPDYALAGAGGFSILVALVVLAAWHTGTAFLVRMGTSGLPMVYNTAAALLLIGAGLVATASGRRLPALLCGGAAALVGAVCLAQSTTGVDLGIDQILHHDLISSSLFPPGRMSMSAAFCVLVPAAALLLMNLKRAPGWCPWLLGAMGSIVASVGCAVLLNDLTAAAAPHALGAFTPMARHSAAVFAVLGAGILVSSWRRVRPERNRSLAPLLLATVILTASIYLMFAIRAAEIRQLKRTAETIAKHVASGLKSGAEMHVRALAKMGNETDARRYAEHHSDFLSIARLDPSFDVRWRAPEAPDCECIAGPARPALERARATGQISASRIGLTDGANVLLVAIPLSSPGSPGYIAGALDLRTLMDSIVKTASPGEASIAILEGNKEVYSWSGGPAIKYLAGTAAANLWGTQWQVRVLPAAAPSVVPWIAGGVGILIAALSALAGLLAQAAASRARELEREVAERRLAQEALAAARAELEIRVQERTAELAHANQELKAEIAERERVEETLRAGEQRYRELFDGAKDVIYVHDLNGKFIAINKAAQQITGYTADEALKMNIAQLVVPEDMETVHTMVASNLGGDANATYDLTIVTKQGRRLILEVSTHLVYRNGNPIAVQGIARDITERRRLEEQLLQSQKMEAVGRLAGGVAHDFNNLLTVIGAYSQMIGDSLPDDERLRSYAQEILWAAERAGTLTNRLLAFSRRQVVQPRLVDLNSLIVTLDNMLRRLIGEDIELKIVLEPGAGAVKADPSHLEQVIMNLAVNARDAMQTGGRLTLRTSRVELDQPPEGGSGLPPGSYIVLEVSDTGAGMTPEILGHIFEPFFTTKEAGKGTGLGLSTVYGIVKQCGGDIQVRSGPGMGAHFTLYFPRAGGSDGPRADPPPAEAPPQADREVVLLVEDEYGVRKLVRKMLAQQGYRVIEAASGEEALRLCERHSGSIHVLLSDVVMPNMSGRELADRLCAVRPDLKVLYMTGYTEDAIVQHGVLEPGVAVLNKPFLADALAHKLREVLDNGKR
jgi:PAS domain S-box-containing protein